MSKIVMTIDSPPYSGEYTLDIPPMFTMREERIIKQMADIVSGQWMQAMADGHLAAVHAGACIAMRRANKAVDPRMFEDLNEQIYSDIKWIMDDDEDPLAQGNNEGQNEKQRPSEKDGPPSSKQTPGNTNRPSTGVPA